MNRTTAADLLEWLRPYHPAAIDGVGLSVDADTPAELWAMAELLQTGIRSLLVRRPWYGIDRHGRGVGPGRDGVLNPAAPLPDSTYAVCVAGDRCWDCVPPDARSEWPQLFASPAAGCGTTAGVDRL